MKDERDEIYASKPLPDSQHIRVLDIKPAKDFHEVVRGQLRVVPLGPFRRTENDEQYQTLSYSWGTFEKCRTMICDDRHFTITDDLDHALRRIRQKIRPDGNFSQTIWIDAICINQNDLEEKSVQVSMMDQIYQNSIRLIVWLGETTVLTTEQVQVAIQSPKLPESSKTLSAISELPWFGRRWIIQEVLKSPTGKRYALFGSFQCYLDTLLIAMNGVQRENSVPLLRAFKESPSHSLATLFRRKLLTALDEAVAIPN